MHKNFRVFGYYAEYGHDLLAEGVRNKRRQLYKYHELSYIVRIN